MVSKYSHPIKKIAWINVAFTPYASTNLSSVGDCLNQYTQGLKKLGVHSTLILPPGSTCKTPHVTLKGELQPSMLVSANTNITHSALQNMVDWAWKNQNKFDLIVNLGHDYLPHSMIGKFHTPYISLPNLGAASDRLDELVQQRAKEFPKNIWFFSKSQRRDLGNEKNPIISQSFDTGLFPNVKAISKNAPLVWAGRITPEKGIETALVTSKMINRPLIAVGDPGDGVYLNELRSKYSLKEFNWEYRGNLARHELYNLISEAFALLQVQNPECKESFGRITAEALLCGCPIIYSDCGANSELIQSCRGGFRLNPENLEEITRHTGSIARSKIQERARLLFGQETVACRFLEQAQALFYPKLKD